jgi:hypothetical protein
VELPNSADETFDLLEALMDFYDPDESKAELFVNLVPPDFKVADILHICNNFDPVGSFCFQTESECTWFLRSWLVMLSLTLLCPS